MQQRPGFGAVGLRSGAKSSTIDTSGAIPLRQAKMRDAHMTDTNTTGTPSANLNLITLALDKSAPWEPRTAELAKTLGSGKERAQYKAGTIEYSVPAFIGAARDDKGAYLDPVVAYVATALETAIMTKAKQAFEVTGDTKETLAVNQKAGKSPAADWDSLLSAERGRWFEVLSTWRKGFNAYLVAIGKSPAAVANNLSVFEANSAETIAQHRLLAGKSRDAIVASVQGFVAAQSDEVKASLAGVNAMVLGALDLSAKLAADKTSVEL